MDIYTYSEARQKLASVLDKAEASGKVLIKRKDGSVFSLTPEHAPASPLDVPSISAKVTTKDISKIPVLLPALKVFRKEMEFWVISWAARMLAETLQLMRLPPVVLALT